METSSINNLNTRELSKIQENSMEKAKDKKDELMEIALIEDDTDSLELEEFDISNNNQTSIRYQLDNDSNEIIVSIIDGTTDEVLRQVPSEQAIKSAKNMQNNASGVLFDTSI